MKKILATLALLTLLTLAFSSQALALPKSGPAKSGVSYKPSFQGNVSSSKFVAPVHKTAKVNSSASNYQLLHAKKFDHGFLYQGKHHNHWTHRRWDSRYNCECFFDPCCSCWYYWCEPDLCYYPVTYCPYRTYCCFQRVVVTPVIVQGSGVPCQSCSQGQVGTTIPPDQGTSEPPMQSEALPAIPAPVQQ